MEPGWPFERPSGGRPKCPSLAYVQLRAVYDSFAAATRLASPGHVFGRSSPRPNTLAKLAAPSILAPCACRSSSAIGRRQCVAVFIEFSVPRAAFANPRPGIARALCPRVTQTQKRQPAQADCRVRALDATH